MYKYRAVNIASVRISGINAGFIDCPDNGHINVNKINATKLTIPYNITNRRHFFMNMHAGMIRHSGLSHSSNMLGDVASCTDISTRNAVTQPAVP